MLLSLLGFDLAVDVLNVIKAQRFSLLAVEVLSSLGLNLLESGLGVGHSLLVSLVIQHSQHLVVVIIDIKLHWVLVVCEQSVVSISQISKSATLYSNMVRKC